MRRVTSWLLEHFASGLIRQGEDLTDAIRTFVIRAIFQGGVNLCLQSEGVLGAVDGI